MFIGSVPTAACYHTDLHCVGARGPARALGLCRALSKGHSWLGPGGHRKLWARPPGGEAWRIPKCAPLASSPNRVRLPTSSSSVQPRVPNHCFTIPIRLQSMGRTTARRAARSKWKLPRAIGRWRCGWVGTPVCTIPGRPVWRQAGPSTPRVRWSAQVSSTYTPTPQMRTGVLPRK